MNKEHRKIRTSSLLKELKKSEHVGHVYKVAAIHSNDRGDVGQGIEIFLGTKITPAQIRKVVDYIVKSYNFDAYYFTKSHSIKVMYRDVK